MERETYVIAKTVLSRVKASEDVQRYDFLSESTLTACARASQNLRQLTITSEERQLLDCTKNIAAVEKFILQYVQEVGKKRHHSKTWKKVYAFSQFARPVLEVFKQANFSPECSIALGLVGLLLIQPLNNKSEIEERLETEMSQLKDIISQVKFSKSNIQTSEMDFEVQGLCAAIIDFLVHALQYQKKWGIVKILGGIVADFAKRFQSFVNKIREHACKIEILAQRGYTTILLDSKETLDRTAQTIQELYTRVATQAAIFDNKIARLENSLAHCRKSIGDATLFEAIKYTHDISRTLLPKPYDFSGEKIFIRQEETSLAPRERWENNISEIQAPEWLTRKPRPILWLGGRQNKRGVSWVSSFSIDVLEVLEMERSVHIAFVLCNSSTNRERTTPLLIFKRTIIQLLKAYPKIAILPENLDKLSLQRFDQAKDSPEAAFKILVDVLEMIDEQCQREMKEVFLLIDRVDVVLLAENSHGKERFLRALHQLSLQYETLRVILTSHFPAQEIGLTEERRRHIIEVWVDTTKPLAMHSR